MFQAFGPIGATYRHSQKIDRFVFQVKKIVRRLSHQIYSNQILVSSTNHKKNILLEKFVSIMKFMSNYTNFLPNMNNRVKDQKILNSNVVLYSIMTNGITECDLIGAK